MYTVFQILIECVSSPGQEQLEGSSTENPDLYLYVSSVILLQYQPFVGETLSTPIESQYHRALCVTQTTKLA